ncbi:MAG: hypothetical protein L0387_18205 [Acidobacteria bacterium]|nr:hypothetical protein [Acidobacteriota bacterium]
MYAPRLVELIEKHSEELARGLMDKLAHSEKASELRKIPDPELRQRIYEVYRNLGDWLLNKTEADIERRYMEIGARRAAQGVALSHVLYALMGVKEHLWSYLRFAGLVDRHVELFQELELLQMVDQFFDRAAYYLVCGYEAATKAKAA